MAKPLNGNKGIVGKTFVVTGGLGYVGQALCMELVRRGAYQIRVLDLRTNSPWSHDLKDHGVHYIQGDVVSKGDVEKALRGMDCVFHIASRGNSVKEMLQPARVDKVNINGTRNVIEACLEFGIQRLVYVSTYNVVFGGKEIVNGNESLPYFPVDSYGHSESIAEQLVLKNNGLPFNKNPGKCLYTCVVRPAAIYGPGEDTHLPRIVSLAKLGLMYFKIGEPSVKTDWIYIDNLVLSLILASKGLLDEIHGETEYPVAAGQPYFVSDGSPVNTFEFIRPLLKSLDYDLPKPWLAVPHALFLGRIFSFFYSILYLLLDQWWLPQPPFLPAEVYKVGVTHYFSILKAKEEISYVPVVTPREGMATTIRYWQDRKRKSLDSPTIYAWILCAITVPGLICCSCLPDTGPVPLIKAIFLSVFRSMWLINLLFVIAVVAHTGEAICAWFIAKRVDPANAKGWFWQTLFLGIFSLQLLLKRAIKLLHCD